MGGGRDGDARCGPPSSDWMPSEGLSMFAIYHQASGSRKRAAGGGSVTGGQTVQLTVRGVVRIRCPRAALCGALWC